MVPNVPLPRGWSKHTRSAALHALALAHFVALHVRGWCSQSRVPAITLVAERDAALARAAALAEEARILRSRLQHIAPQRRPHYPPTSRLAILELRAARGWTLAETARRFLVSEQTLANWMRRLHDDGQQALVPMPEPVNRFPDFLRHVVGALGRALPTMGKVRLAQMLARAGVHLAASTVHRMRKGHVDNAPEPGSEPEPSSSPPPSRPKAARTVTARYPHHVWNVDFSILPIASGFWVPWLPHSLVQRWPFCFWLAAVLDHHSRAVVVTRIFFSQPSAAQLTRLLEAARRRAGVTPKYIVSDSGSQFQDLYLAWCSSRGVTPRFGAVGKSGSIAVLEHFFRSLKDEMLDRLPLVPVSIHEMRREVDVYTSWYNDHRPHQGLAGRTPAEVRDGRHPLLNRHWETRPRYPLARGDPARNRRPTRRVRGCLVLHLRRVEGRDHLPIVELRHVA